jgi:hypothetical protein
MTGTHSAAVSSLETPTPTCQASRAHGIDRPEAETLGTDDCLLFPVYERQTMSAILNGLASPPPEERETRSREKDRSPVRRSADRALALDSQYSAGYVRRQSISPDPAPQARSLVSVLVSPVCYSVVVA